jgi:hypothetical protein
MAQSKRKRHRKGRESKGFRISEKTRNIALIVASCVLVIGGGYWAYATFSTVAPPDLQKASAQEVASFLGNDRGISRMNIDEREAYLANVFTDRFGRGEDQTELNRALRRMSSMERQVLQEATFEVAKVRVLDHARDYQNMSGRQQAQFVDQAIRDFEQLQRHIGTFGQQATGRQRPKNTPVGPRGGPAAPPEESFIEDFRRDMPTGSDELMKAVVSRTNARERAVAQPLLEAIAARKAELEDSNARARFDMGL